MPEPRTEFEVRSGPVQVRTKVQNRTFPSLVDAPLVISSQPWSGLKGEDVRPLPYSLECVTGHLFDPHAYVNKLFFALHPRLHSLPQYTGLQRIARQLS